MQQETNPFSDLLRRYTAGDCSPGEEKFVSDWYRSLGKGRKGLSFSEEEELAVQHKLWQSIQGRTGAGGAEDTGAGKKRPSRRGMRWFIYLPGAAAAFLVLFLFFTKQEQAPGKESAREVSVREKVNNTGKTILLVLQDESMVWLKPLGSVRYTDFSMSPRREVTLTGEAYFEVAKNPEKPFLVHAGNVVTRVTGTKFNVKAYEDDKTVEIEVTEGSVEVTGERAEVSRGAGGSRSPDLKLTASQRAVYHTGSHKLEKLSAVSSQLKRIETVSEKLFFEFSDTPLRKVIDLLEEAYPVSIELENAALESCPLTASLNDETLDIKLELICRSIGATFSKSPGKIMISGPGCGQ